MTAKQAVEIGVDKGLYTEWGGYLPALRKAMQIKTGTVENELTAS